MSSDHQPHGNFVARFVLKFIRKGFSINTFDNVYDTSGGTMKRTLKWWQLMLLGVGKIWLATLPSHCLSPHKNTHGI